MSKMSSLKINLFVFQTKYDSKLVFNCSELIMKHNRDAPYLKIAEVNHAVHHLTDAEAVAKVVERVVTVVLLNPQLEEKRIIHSETDFRLLS